MRIIQLLPTISFGDAVGNDTVALDRFIRSMGFETAIYAENIDRRLPAGTAIPYERFPRLGDDDVILYHASTGTKLNYELPDLSGRKIVRYHNITPPEFFQPYSLNAAALCRDGYDGIRFLADKIDYAIADSEYNRQQLINMGYRCQIDVCPILIPFEDYHKQPNAKIIKKYSSDEYTNLLFVGRISPNKKQEYIIQTFTYYKKHINPKARLFLVGSYNGMEAYFQRLREYCKLLQLSEEDVIFTGSVPFADILAYYRIADSFICMSEHEGFCVPIVEAMYFSIPIVAFGSTAVPETLGNGGIVLEENNPKLFARTIQKVHESPECREHMREKQKQELSRYQYPQVSSRFSQLLRQFLAAEHPRKRRIYQLVANLHKGDAIGNDVIAMKRALCEFGAITEIYANAIDSGFTEETAKYYKDLPPLAEDDLIIYHFGTACDIAKDIPSFPCKVVLRYHNITPPSFFHGLNPAAEDATKRGLRQVKQLGRYIDFCLPVSSFNGEDLRKMGYTCPMHVLPIMIPFHDYEQAPDQSVIQKYSDGRKNILFVGRIAPNKKIEDVISAFAEYKKTYDASARLFLVGSYNEKDLYYQKLQAHILQKGVKDIVFSGHISFSAILAYYHLADVFLCMSEHEGFCVPLTEAMFFRKPVVAYKCCAVPETLGGSGVLVENKNYPEIAGIINRLICDQGYRESVIKSQDSRLKDFRYEVVRDQLIEYLREFLTE